RPVRGEQRAAGGTSEWPDAAAICSHLHPLVMPCAVHLSDATDAERLTCIVPDHVPDRSAIAGSVRDAVGFEPGAASDEVGHRDPFVSEFARLPSAAHAQH